MKRTRRSQHDQRNRTGNRPLTPPTLDERLHRFFDPQADRDQKCDIAAATFLLAEKANAQLGRYLDRSDGVRSGETYERLYAEWDDEASAYGRMLHDLGLPLVVASQGALYAYQPKGWVAL